MAAAGSWFIGVLVASMIVMEAVDAEQKGAGWGVASLDDKHPTKPDGAGSGVLDDDKHSMKPDGAGSGVLDDDKHSTKPDGTGWGVLYDDKHSTKPDGAGWGILDDDKHSTHIGAPAPAVDVNHLHDPDNQEEETSSGTTTVNKGDPVSQEFQEVPSDFVVLGH